MQFDTGIRTTTTVRLSEDERFVLDTGSRNGKILVTRVVAHTDLNGDLGRFTGLVVDGLRFKQDGTAGKAVASGVFVYSDDLPQVPQALLDGVKASVQAEAAQNLAGQA